MGCLLNTRCYANYKTLGAPITRLSKCAKPAPNLLTNTVLYKANQFERLGVTADWANEYWTIHPEYEAAELETFAKFVEQGLVYRSKKPVYWSIPCATALAEAEIEYKDHTSISIFVKLRLSDEARNQLDLPDEDSSILIWTTTPWTLPANLAVSVHPKIEYSAIKTAEHGTLIVATALIESVIEE